MYLYAGMNDT